MLLSDLQRKVWDGHIPLEIRLSPVECRAYNSSPPYITLLPRVSYLPLLLSRLHLFFAPQMIEPNQPGHRGWFSFDGVPLKWQHPVGLLYDLFSGAEPAAAGRSLEQTDSRNSSDRADSELPWRLELHFSDWPDDQLIPLDLEEKMLRNVFTNSVKEADFLRNGTAKVIMSLSKDDSTNLWGAVVGHNLSLFSSIHGKFFDSTKVPTLRHLPIKIYMPIASLAAAEAGMPARGSVKVVQGLVSPGGEHDRQTLGGALHTLLPTVFPSRRSYMYAQAVLHGAIVPPSTIVLQLLLAAAYPDGFLHIAVQMVS